MYNLWQRVERQHKAAELVADGNVRDSNVDILRITGNRRPKGASIRLPPQCGQSLIMARQSSSSGCMCAESV